MNKKLHKILLSFIFLITLSDQVWSVTIKPGPQSYEEIQTALIFANPGSPPFGEASKFPLLFEVEIIQKGEREMK